VDREGHARVPDPGRGDGYRLGVWVRTQRAKYGKGMLDPERRARLEALPGWIWGDRWAERWEEGFAHLQRFVEREGHARVPHQWREGGYGLGGWVSHQRVKYSEGRLDPERRARLEALPGWTWNLLAEAWEEGFAYLQRFVGREGHARVPPRYREDEFGLGGWVSIQRAKYGKGMLDPERRGRLEALPGWTWDPYADDWEEGFAHLNSFVEREGHARVPAHYHEDGYRLGQWVTVQRSAFRNERLDETRRRRLESLYGWTWNARER
jgi:hypothetical protein